MAAAVARAARRLSLAAARPAAASRATLRPRVAASCARHGQRGQRKQGSGDDRKNFRFHGKNPFSVRASTGARRRTEARAHRRSKSADCLSIEKSQPNTAAPASVPVVEPQIAKPPRPPAKAQPASKPCPAPSPRSGFLPFREPARRIAPLSSSASHHPNAGSRACCDSASPASA